jgi:hypothetical protein
MSCDHAADHESVSLSSISVSVVVMTNERLFVVAVVDGMVAEAVDDATITGAEVDVQYVGARDVGSDVGLIEGEYEGVGVGVGSQVRISILDKVTLAAGSEPDDNHTDIFVYKVAFAVGA